MHSSYLLGASAYSMVVRHGTIPSVGDFPMIVAGAQTSGADASLIAFGGIAYKDNWFGAMDYTFGGAPRVGIP